MWKRRKMTSKKRHVNHRHGAKTGKDNGATARVEVSHQHGRKGGIDSRDSLTSTGELHAQRIKNRAGSIWPWKTWQGGSRRNINHTVHPWEPPSFLSNRPPPHSPPSPPSPPPRCNDWQYSTTTVFTERFPFLRPHCHPINPTHIHTHADGHFRNKKRRTSDGLYTRARHHTLA